MKIWGGSLDKEFSLYMKELAPGADAIPLGKFVIYSDASESNGFSIMRKYISDGKTFMAISYSGTHEFISRAPALGGLNDWQWAELTCENALYHFVDTH